ncbi:MAG: hypothetical protein M4579_005826 [Chaenotheca gracillima]|nr:MAG: hypothetical protein M4579_005826 [Chaenotheca gracillima]
MKLLSVFVLALAAEGAVASNWFSKAAYNKWHETELERWLSDHDVPYPTPADRKDLENLVKDNWESKVRAPYREWHPSQLQSFLEQKGQSVTTGGKEEKDDLANQVKKVWFETEDQAEDSYSSVKDWIFDSWTDSHLKSFLDKHGIPAPQPRKRDSVLQTVRQNYETVAKKAGQTTLYPGNWLYDSWSESDLKSYLDERGIPVPQPSSRDKLIASVRRNARLASLKLQDNQAAAASSASAAKESLSDSVLNAWSDSQIKEWADKNSIKVPQGSTRNELLAIARKHRAQLTGDNVSDKAASAYGAATSRAGNEGAKATDDAQAKTEDAFNSAIGSWSSSRLKAFLDARGVPAPQSGKKDELIKQVRLNKHKAANGFSIWTFDTWTTENLKSYLSTQSDKASQKASKKSDASRAELVKHAQDSYASASKAGGSNYASVTSSIASATGSVKDSAFDQWTASDLKAYLDDYGIPVPHGTKTEELKALARRQSTYFKYGTSSPSGTFFAKIQNGAQWVLDQLKVGAASGRQEVGEQSEKAAEKAKDAKNAAKNEL